MFSEIMASLASASTAVADWFVDFLQDGIGIVGLWFVLGMVFLSIIYRFLLAPAFSHAGNISGSLAAFAHVGLGTGSGSDSVAYNMKPHPSFVSNNPNVMSIDDATSQNWGTATYHGDPSQIQDTSGT